MNTGAVLLFLSILVSLYWLYTLVIVSVNAIVAAIKDKPFKDTECWIRLIIIVIIAALITSYTLWIEAL